MVKAIILDLDGTLVFSHDAHVKAYECVLKEQGIVVKEKRLSRKFGMIAEDIIRELLPDLTDDEVKRVVEGKRECFKRFIDLVKPAECADDLIKGLSSDYVLAIGTSASRVEMNVMIDRFGWRDFFKVLKTSYDVPEPKPAPDLLLSIISDLGLTPEDCVYVGDSIFDARAARSAGVKFYGLTTGSYSVKDFSDEGFDSYPNLCSVMKFFG